jgi:lysophospholipase L1-like esterase
VAVGDSIAASQLCRCARYPDYYAQLAAEGLGQPVRAQNMAVNGATSDDLLYRLTNMPEYQVAIREADLITISIGFNDIGSCTPGTERACYKAAIAGLKTNLEAILTQIDGLQGSHPHVLRETGYYNFVIGRTGAAQPDPSFLTFYAKQLAVVNATICAAATAHDGLCVELLTAFNGPAGDQDAGSLLADDHLHPSTEGHKLIAQTIADAGYAPLLP